NFILKSNSSPANRNRRDLLSRHSLSALVATPAQPPNHVCTTRPLQFPIWDGGICLDSSSQSIINSHQQTK
ncbi:hypothetical protein TNIN_186671, partial [Trichonephila inaurata madagascariensis]